MNLIARITGLCPSLVCVLLLSLLQPLQAETAAGFRVEDIRVEGLQRLPVERVFLSLAIQSGDVVDGERLRAAMRALFATGDFEDVTIARDGDVLVVMVQERPTIAGIELKGNKAIGTEDLMKGLEAAGLAEGEVFRRSTLAGITGELERQYVAQGRYSATIESEMTALPRNRVGLSIKIFEGKSARIRDINIVGNDTFSDAELLKQFELRATHITSFFKSDDKYSRERLGGDLERLRSYYLNRGYVNFSLDATQVTLTPEWREVLITLSITEGKQYKVRNVKLAGDLVVDEAQLKPLLIVREGQIFSQQLLTSTTDLLTRRLGNEGYTFADVNGFTETNEEDNTVDVTFFIDPGKRAYVRRINFTGNNKTLDEVLRRELRQFEQAPANSALINLSRQRLQRLGFFSTVETDTARVPGADDLIDVNIAVEEQPSGSIGANVGFSDASGFIFGANVSQNNFMGSGNQVSFSLSRSELRDSYNFSFQDPFYTLDGVSRGFSLFFSQTDFDEFNVSAFGVDRVGGSVTFGYPISEISRLSFGLTVDRLDIIVGTFASLESCQFLESQGELDASQTFPANCADTESAFQAFKLNAGWRASTLNRGVFPDRGWSQNISFEVATPGSDLQFYKLTWAGQRFFPVTRNLTLRARSDIAFGDGYGSDLKALPFFENFFSGGIGSVRGYESRSLGPRSPIANSPTDPDPDPVGGNFLTEASLELIFPPPFAPDSRSLRTVLFFDAGNVWQTEISGRPGFAVDNLRMSGGVALTWLTAIGPIGFSFAKPFNDQPGDDTETFQFTLGQTF